MFSIIISNYRWSYWVDNNMKTLVWIVCLMMMLGACSITKSHVEPSQSVTVCGLTYNKITGVALNGTFLINKTRGGGAVSDSLGKFSLTACAGDSIRFLYVGMKDTVAVITPETVSPWNIGLDTAQLILIDKGVHLSHP